MNAHLRFIHDKFAISGESFTHGWNMPYSHYHNDFEIYILEYGERIVCIDDKNYITSEHDAVMFASGTPHRSFGNTPFKGICIHFSQLYMDLYFTDNAKKALLNCFKKKTVHLNSRDFERIKEIAEGFVFEAENNFVLLAEILKILNLSSETNSVFEDKFVQKSAAEEILNYTEKNYCEIKNILFLSEKFGVSENYVFKVFKKHCGMTPKQYINHLRLKYACHKLENTGNTVKFVCGECGFDSYEYFIRLFKKEIGCTPTEYRKLNRKK